MKRRLLVPMALSVALLMSTQTNAQTSSIGANKRKAEEGRVIQKAPREAQRVERNLVYEAYSWTSSPPRLPKTYRPGDLITIIVRERRRFEAEADLDTKRKFDVKSELDAFFKLKDGGLAPVAFKRGKPAVDYTYTEKTKNEGDTNREDAMTTRLTGKIIDVKPNGLLVIEARARVVHDDETSEITLTGICRKEDVTADNTVLSTQVADKDIVVHNEGAIRSSSGRGWILKLLDLLRPI